MSVPVQHPMYIDGQFVTWFQQVGENLWGSEIINSDNVYVAFDFK